MNTVNREFHGKINARVISYKHLSHLIFICLSFYNNLEFAP